MFAHNYFLIVTALITCNISTDNQRTATLTDNQRTATHKPKTQDLSANNLSVTLYYVTYPIILYCFINFINIPLYNFIYSDTD